MNTQHYAVALVIAVIIALGSATRVHADPTMLIDGNGTTNTTDIATVKFTLAGLGTKKLKMNEWLKSITINATDVPPAGCSLTYKLAGAAGEIDAMPIGQAAATVTVKITVILDDGSTVSGAGMVRFVKR